MSYLVGKIVRLALSMCLVAPMVTHTFAESFRIGLMESAFTYSGANVQDAKAAMQVWAHQIGMQLTDSTFHAEPRVYSNLREVRHDLELGRLDAISISTLDYLALHDDALLEPGIVAFGHDGKPTASYVLLRKKGLVGGGLESLEQTSLLIPVSEVDQLALRWLDLELMRSGLDRSRGHFKRIKQVDRTSQAVLSVFFGQADACLVTARSLETMIEMNPQIGEALQKVAESPELLPVIMSFRKGVDPELRDALTASILRLPEISQGRQALALFKQTGLRRYEATDLGPVRQLLRDFEDALGRMAVQ